MAAHPVPSHPETIPQTHSPSVFLVFEPGTKGRTDDSDCKGSSSSAGAETGRRVSSLQEEGSVVGRREEYDKGSD